MTDVATRPSTPTDWAILAARAADDRLGVDTLLIDVGDVLAVTDFFVITNGENARQVRGLVDDIEKQIAEVGGPRPLRVEGLDTMQWVLLDYGVFVVHVFDAEMRAFYQLERLWGDRPRVTYKQD
jgi:ribosome-associated protein